MNRCTKCHKPCEIISIEQYDMEEFWGAPVRRYYSEDASECCQAEVEELTVEDINSNIMFATTEAERSYWRAMLTEEMETR